MSTFSGRNIPDTVIDDEVSLRAIYKEGSAEGLHGETYEIFEVSDGVQMPSSFASIAFAGINEDDDRWEPWVNGWDMPLDGITWEQAIAAVAPHVND